MPGQGSRRRRAEQREHLQWSRRDCNALEALGSLDMKSTRKLRARARRTKGEAIVGPSFPLYLEHQFEASDGWITSTSNVDGEMLIRSSPAAGFAALPHFVPETMTTPRRSQTAELQSSARATVKADSMPRMLILDEAHEIPSSCTLMDAALQQLRATARTLSSFDVPCPDPLLLSLATDSWSTCASGLEVDLAPQLAQSQHSAQAAKPARLSAVKRAPRVQGQTLPGHTWDLGSVSDVQGPSILGMGSSSPAQARAPQQPLPPSADEVPVVQFRSHEAVAGAAVNVGFGFVPPPGLSAKMPCMVPVDADRRHPSQILG